MFLFKQRKEEEATENLFILQIAETLYPVVVWKEQRGLAVLSKGAYLVDPTRMMGDPHRQQSRVSGGERWFVRLFWTTR